MTVNEFIEKYKSENFKSYLKEDATIDYWNDLIKTFKIERLNFVFPDTLLLNPKNVLNENGNPFNVQFDGFCERQIKIFEIENYYSNDDIVQVKSYLKSYNQISFDEVSNKRNEDGTINNIYLGNNFNEWLENINKNLNSNDSYDAEILDKLKTYNKYLCFLANSIVNLYKAISGYNRTKDTSFITSLHIQEKEVLNHLKSIDFYVEIIKSFIRSKQYLKANDIKEYCLALFDNLTYNLNDVLTIDVFKSPVKKHFEDVKTDLKSSINFEELKMLTDLNKSNDEIVSKRVNKYALINHNKKSVNQPSNSIVFTLNEYELLYEDRLFEHNKIHIDYDEDHFIFEEKNNYDFYLELIFSIGCVPDEMMNEKHIFPIIIIDDFDYNNLYFKEGAMECFFYLNEENDKGCIVIEEARSYVMNVINLFKNLTFDEFVFKAHTLKNSFRLIIKFLKEKKKEKKRNSLGETTNLKKNVIIENSSIHPMFDPNLWNLECFELFKYLYDCYYKNKNRQLTNIWFYLKESGITKYNIKVTKDRYKIFVLQNYGIKITNFDKAQIKWEDQERETINEHRINFEDSLK
jgi:hypothetical protein